MYNKTSLVTCALLYSCFVHVKYDVHKKVDYHMHIKLCIFLNCQFIRVEKLLNSSQNTNDKNFICVMCLIKMCDVRISVKNDIVLLNLYTQFFFYRNIFLSNCIGQLRKFILLHCILSMCRERLIDVIFSIPHSIIKPNKSPPRFII